MALGLIVSSLAIAPAASAQDIGTVMGGGNFTNGRTDQTSQFAALNAIKARMARINVYPDYYYRNGVPTPERLDAVMLQAYQAGIKPMILFEYYGNYAPAIPLGDYNKWRAIGFAFASRFRPNGTWAVANGISNWGVTVYAAMNEPDVRNTIPKPAYHDAIEGLADGVHAASPSLKVIPGGFARQNSHSDYTLRGYGPAIADLFNNGKLDGIDLHTYFDVIYARMEGTYEHSAQHDFDAVKAASGITADINFYATEFNFKRPPAEPGEEAAAEAEAAKGLLTAIWDNLGVVKNDGATRARQFVFPWSIFGSDTNDPAHGLNVTLNPWTPNARGRTLQLVLSKTVGMTFRSLDPKGKGEYVLAGGGKKMWVWQNRPEWTNQPGTTYRVEGIPASARRMEIIGWDGVRRTLPLTGQPALTVTNLPQNETLMFLTY